MTTRIAFVNGKGGVGKTTCALLLAAALIHAKQDVSIEDRDPQGSATTAAGIFGFPVGEGGKIVIIDTAPNLALPTTREAIRTADLVVLVTTPSPLDLATTAATASLIQVERSGPTRVLFNLVQTNNRFFDEMPGIAKEIPFPTFKHYLTRLTVYQVAQLVGWKALPVKPREEVLQLAMEIAAELPA
jgi:chromosome partitioning protein